MTTPNGRTALGVTHAFSLTLDGAPFGYWSGCSGIDVKAKLHTTHNPGDYSHEEIMFADVSYDSVTLIRAVDSTSQQLRDWVREQWSFYRQPHYAPFGMGGLIFGTTATITLLDASWQTVTSWTLQRAYPYSYKGPNLDATSSKVATEQLRLAHEGFMDKQGLF